MPKVSNGGKSEGVSIKVIPDDTIEIKRLYANYVDVNHTPYDFSLRFSDAAPIYKKDQIDKSGEYRVPVVIEVAIPINLMPGLIRALNTQFEKYQKDYGKEQDVKE